MIFFFFVVKQVFFTLLLILIFNVSAAYCQNTKNNRDIKASVVLILDSSFSMRLTYNSSYPGIHGESRLKKAKTFLYSLLTAEKQKNIEWALVSFGEDIGKGRDIILKVPFTTSYKRILNSAEHINAWGLSPLNSAISFGMSYCNTGAAGRKKIVIVITDGISTDTNGLLPSENRILQGLNQGPLELYFIGFPLPDNVKLKKMTENGNLKLNSKEADNYHFYYISQLKTVMQKISQSIASLENKPAVPVKKTPTAAPASRRITVKHINPFFIVFLLLTALILISLLYFAFIRKPKETEKVPVGTRPFINLKIISSSGQKELKRLHKVPAKIAQTGNADIILNDAGFTGKQKEAFLRIEYFNNTPFIRSNFPLNINGVSRKQKKLKEGDHILFGRYRIYFLCIGSENVYEIRKKKPYPIYTIHAAAFLLMVFLVLVLGVKPVITKTRKLEQVQKMHAGSSVPKTKVEPLKNKSKVIPPAKLIKESIPLGKIVYTKPRIYKPGDKIAYFKADILFFHAHPDDESLDFGCLMAQAARAGKKVVTVLFTDGESGLDQYPARIVNGTYPPHDLKGKALAGVRVKEAQKAMSILGSRVYIRLGLKNHPYSSIKQVMSKEAVFKDWGGETELIKKVTEIIEGYHPDIIVAPDLHTAAYEHFEHEAVGYIIRKAVSKINNIDNSFIKGYIVSVDPLQREAYPGRIRIDAMGRDRKLDIPYRLIQREALKQHITQRDASVIGVEILPNFRYEYYAVEKWDVTGSLESYIKK